MVLPYQQHQKLRQFQQKSQSSHILKNKPFWIWYGQEHLKQAQEFKVYYSVIPFPHDELTDLIRLTEEQRNEFVKQFKEDRKKQKN